MIILLYLLFQIVHEILMLLRFEEYLIKVVFEIIKTNIDIIKLIYKNLKQKYSKL